MSPDYAKLVTTPEFFGPPGTMPLMTVSPIPQPISREEIHVKELEKKSLENELEYFLKYLAQTYILNAAEICRFTCVTEIAELY